MITLGPLFRQVGAFCRFARLGSSTWSTGSETEIGDAKAARAKARLITVVVSNFIVRDWDERRRRVTVVERFRRRKR
jgi:hypothetical protein